LNSIQSGPYKNIYNPENFFIGQQGIGAGNNWGAGYAAGEVVQEEVFDMIDREADGSDSLEVRHLGGRDRTFLEITYEYVRLIWYVVIGLHVPAFDCRRNWLRTW
jgi:hypothetical protein